MALFDHHAPHTKKKIALGLTVAVGVVLVAVLIILFRVRGQNLPQESSPFKDFYNTVLQGTQSFLPQK